MTNRGLLVVTLFGICFCCCQTGAVATNATPYKTVYDLMSATPELSAALALFNHTGLLPLLQNPNTTMTCFLPASNDWMSASDTNNQWATNPPGRYEWAVLLQHCLEGQKALTVNRLLTNGTIYQSAFPESTIMFEKINGATYFNGDLGEPGRIIKADMKGGKSIIHITDNGNQYPSIAPPDSYDTVYEFLEYYTPFAIELFNASSLGGYLAGTGRTKGITVFAPRDQAFDSLLKQLRITRRQLLGNRALVELLTRAHVVDGQALYTGALIRYGAPLQVNTLAGPVNATADFTIFPKRSGAAKVIVLSNRFGSAIMSDYDVGGNSRWYEETPQYVAHFLDKVLLPASIKDLKLLL